MSDTITLAAQTLKALADMIQVVSQALEDDDLEKVQRILEGEMATTLIKKSMLMRAMSELPDE